MDALDALKELDTFEVRIEGKQLESFLSKKRCVYFEWNYGEKGADGWIVPKHDADDAANRSSVRCYTARLVCREARLQSTQAAAHWGMAISGTYCLHVGTTNNSAEASGLA